jgi:hypothetical protein
MPGCPVRYRPGSGPDRPCPMHREHGDTLAVRMAAFADLAAPPGDGQHDGADANRNA